MSFFEWAPRLPTVPIPKPGYSFLISLIHIIGSILQQAMPLIGSQVRWNKRDAWLIVSLLLCADGSGAAAETHKSVN